ncbi:MAG: hypothetical protein JNJ77_19980 [Planctomycetia bacterium]|nr:hypothetical protein [Planctomycetia bacterium]
MRSLLCLLFVSVMVISADASDRKGRGRSAWAWAGNCQAIESPKTVIEPPVSGIKSADSRIKTADPGITDALAEVNAARSKRGLPPFQQDPLLTQAAQEAARQRASQGIAGHLASDFDCLPAGAHADAAGCGALDDSWGWGTCCTYDNYTHAGAAWVRGSDGKRYMHLFVRNEAATTAPVRTGEVVTNSYSSCSGGNCSTGTWQPGGIITRGRRGSR